MKRRVISIFTALVLCLSLCPTGILAADQIDQIREDRLNSNSDIEEVQVVKSQLSYDTRRYSITAKNSPVFRVEPTGTLYLKGSGQVISEDGAGVKVMSGGQLYVKDIDDTDVPDLTITGTTYGLEIEPGAIVKLSGGTYTGGIAPIMFDGDLRALLGGDYAYFDSNGAPLTDVASAKTVVIKGQPKIEWAKTTETVKYSGNRVEIDKLPSVTVTSPDGVDDLTPYVEYSYRKAGSDDTFKAGLPRNAGTYEIKASIPAQPDKNCVAAETETCLTLTINKIPAVETPPMAKDLTYNRAPQELVTAGVLKAGAVAEGAVIEFKTSADAYSTNIPTGTNTPGYNEADYNVWYQVADTENYTGVPETKIENVSIKPKEITPTIDLLQSSFTYTGSKCEPVITVRDGQPKIDDDQYTIAWTNSAGDTVYELRAADIYTATITSKGNYTFLNNTTATVEIVAASQNALSITGIPDHVYYGDKITTLRTTGGTDNGNVTWSITAGGENADIDQTSGELNIKGVGSVTVKAERAVPNYGTVSDTWTFTVEPKSVTAVLTGVDRVYVANSVAATVNAEVKASDLVSGDSITIDPLLGTFEDENVGTNKKITITSPAPTAKGPNGTDISDKYAITYPATATADIEPKEVTVTVTLSDHDLQTDAGGYYYEFDGTEKTPNVTVTIQEDNTIIPAGNNYSVSYGNNINVSTAPDKATVTVTAKAGGNYMFKNGPVTANFEIRDAQAVLTKAPKAKDLTYTGKAQDLVMEGAATGGKVVYSSTGAADSYTDKIPQGTNAGNYTVYYKVEGDGNHSANTSGQVPVTIKQKEITPAITLDPTTYVYDGNAKTPEVTVKDGNVTVGTKVTASNTHAEFTVSYSKNTNAGTATVTVTDKAGGNYSIRDASKTFMITKATPDVTAPTDIKDLEYKAETKQALINEVSSPHGTMLYSLDGTNFSRNIPTGTDAGTYTVYYKVQGDSNHTDSAVGDPVNVTINKQTVTPKVQLTPSSAQYDGSVKHTTVTLRDDTDHLIPTGEYKVTFDPATNWKDKGLHTVKIENIDGGNYTVTNTTVSFEITAADQNPLTIVNKPGLVRYGDSPFTLSAVGGSGNGEITWTSSDVDVATVDTNGHVTITGAGTVTITAEKAGTNYDKSTATYTFTVAKKPITAIVTADNKPYDGNTNATIHVTWKNGDLVGTDQIDTSELVGKFDSEDVGTNITVRVTGNVKDDTTSQKYAITIPPTTASIFKAISTVPSLTPKDRTYDGTNQALVSGGEGNIGPVEYRLGEDGEYSFEVPEATNAGTYTVWYKVSDTDNYTGIDAQSKEVTIARKKIRVLVELAEKEYAYTGYEINPDVTTVTPVDDGVTITTDDYVVVGYENNIAVGTAKVTVKNTDSSNYEFTGEVDFEIKDLSEEGNIENGDDAPIETSTNNRPASSTASTSSTLNAASAANVPIQTSVRNGTATSVMSASAGRDLVKAAAADQSKNVVVKPEISGEVTKAEVSIPASTVGQLKSATSADLTISTPIAGVTIPNAALSTLSSAGGTVNVVTEQVDDAVSVTLTAGGKEVDSIPGGLTLTLPVEDPTPGTVAVLIHDDGTRETIPKAVPENGEMNIKLDGSATVAIVDNSKAFDDVQATDWEADAVAFTSAHELFNGTSETTFSPDEPMSLGMLATVLYNLEGRPGRNSTDGSDETSSDAWYTAGVSWAEENGITDGHGDGVLDPEENMTRERFIVMLWKYAGSPTADGQALEFTDIDQASSYAMDALRWAIASGILNGYGNGQLDPGGLTTRAQAAQILKNFMEKV